MSTVEDAVDLADRGYAVFPCHSLRAAGKCSCGKSDCRNIAKHPRVKDWRTLATDDEDQIREWWREWPDANIGLATGEQSNLWVLDLDQKDYGPEVFERFRAGREVKPAVVRTGGGGAHLYFLWNSDLEVTNRAGVLKGVDVRGNGGYVIAPGSVHATGALYEWGADVEPELAPDWLMELVLHGRSAVPDIDKVQDDKLPESEVDRINEALKFVSPEGRDEWLRVGMALHSTGAGAQAFHIWTQWSKTCPSKFDPADQSQTWLHFKKGADLDVGLASLFYLARQGGWVGGDTRVVEVANVSIELGELWTDTPEQILEETRPYPFPIDQALPPGELRDFVKSVAACYQVQPELPAMLALPVLTSCLAQKFEVAYSEGWREITALWVAVALRSGERKSAIMSEMTAPLRAWEKSELDAFKEEMPEYERVANRLQAQLKVAEKKEHQGHDGAEVEVNNLMLELKLHEAKRPFAGEIVLSEPTTEALGMVMQRNHERILVASPEADPLDVALGRYDTGSPNLGIWLAGHAGDTFKSSRATREPTILQRPALSMAVTPQPQAMRELFSSRASVDKGFLARFIFGLPETLLGTRSLNAKPVDRGLRESWHRVCRRLLTRTVPSEPVTVTLTPDARYAFDKLRARVESMLGDTSRAPAATSWYSKLPGTVLRIALAIHGATVLDSPNADQISDETMGCALAWVPFLEANFRRASGAATEDPDALLAHAAIRWLAKSDKDGETITRAELFKALRGTGGLKKRGDLDGAVNILIDGSWIRLVREKTGRTGRPREWFNVHPQLSEHFKEESFE